MGKRIHTYKEYFWLFYVKKNKKWAASAQRLMAAQRMK